MEQDFYDRLTKFCNLLSSDKPGEVAAAANKANQLLEKAGLQWKDVLNPKAPPSPFRSTSPPPPPPHKAKSKARHMDVCDAASDLEQAGVLRGKEYDFLSSIALKANGDLSEKQQAWVDSIRYRAKQKGIL